MNAERLLERPALRSAFSVHRCHVMVLNRQRAYAADLPGLRAYVRSLKQVLGLGGRDFNVCLVADREMARLNAAYRCAARPTDVLSFPWKGDSQENGDGLRGREFHGFLGDVAISVETARRNARREGHSTLNEIRWLILHGALHLLGYDHERDHGEMAQLEHALREQLGTAGRRERRRGRKRAQGLHG